jgi:hypothetical protein
MSAVPQYNHYHLLFGLLWHHTDSMCITMCNYCSWYLRRGCCSGLIRLLVWPQNFTQSILPSPWAWMTWSFMSLSLLDHCSWSLPFPPGPSTPAWRSLSFFFLFFFFFFFKTIHYNIGLLPGWNWGSGNGQSQKDLLDCLLYLCGTWQGQEQGSCCLFSSFLFPFFLFPFFVSFFFFQIIMPPLTPESEEEKVEFAKALERREVRLKRKYILGSYFFFLFFFFFSSSLIRLH